LVKKVAGHTSDAWQPPIVVPRAEEVLAAAEVLNAGKKTVILAGQGALGACTELEQLADLLGASIVKPLLGKRTVPDDSPFTTGGIGLLGTAPSEEAMEQADTLDGRHELPIHGVLPEARSLPRCADRSRSLPYRAPLPGGDRVVRRREGDSPGSAGAGPPARKPQFLERAQSNMKTWRALMYARSHRDELPLKPQVVADTLSDLLADDATISTDSGTITAWAARYIQIKRGQLFSCSGNLASMANGLPYAIAAQIAYPGRQSVAFVGDGGFTMLMGEFATAVKYRLPIKIVVIKNNALGMIKWEQMVFLGNPEYGVSLEPIDFVRFAEACGGIGVRCERPDEVRGALEALMRADGPALCEAVVDPFEPPMPARVTAKQALHMAEALARGEPNRGRIALTLFRDKIHDLRGK
jgi:pyruvate dehydrogenase (quinone)